MNSEMGEDIILVRKTRRGDQQAFRQLVEKYQNYVFTIGFRVLKNREEAEEAAQSTFLKVYENLDSFAEESKFSTWLYTVAYRTALDQARRKKLDTHSIDDEDSYLQVEDRSHRNPAEQMHQQDIQKQVRAAINRLAPLDASIVSMFYLHDMQVKQIAQITELSVSNVKTKLYRLREAMREDLSQHLQAEISDML
ncbi:MAG: sigma-70 family RNA polymerase sigma factor [Saprospiraceae bacterium]|nr:sigma-70 family RNA polymerase sigma factor [Saprospiraceae bacterium]